MRFFLMLMIGAVSGVVTSACGYSYFNPETMITALIINATVIIVSAFILFLVID